MTSKEALDNLHRCALCYKSSNHDEWINHCRKVRNIIEKDLDRLENLERQNKLLKKNLKEYQAYIKKGVEEHYEDFMSDYDLLLQENHELNKKLEILERIKKEAIIQEHYKKGYGRYYTAGIEEFFYKIKEWLENE